MRAIDLDVVDNGRQRCRDAIRVAPLTSRLRRAAEQLARIGRPMA
jgi:hypothetical protein